MSKEINNTPEKYGKAIMLLMLFMSLSILSGTINNMFGDQWSGNFRTSIWILSSLFSILTIWFAIKVLKSSSKIKNNRKFLKQLRDERNLEIDYKSRARGYLGCIIFAGIYGTSAIIQKVLFNNDFLFKIDGFYIALMVVAIGGIVTVSSHFYLNK